MPNRRFRKLISPSPIAAMGAAVLLVLVALAPASPAPAPPS